MFGMGFMEIFLILMVAIIALGPEKLPGAAVDVARFFKKMKSGLDEAKSTLDSELNISEMKKEAESFKANMGNVKSLVDVDLDDLSNIMDDEPVNKKEPVLAKESSEKNAEDFKVKKVSKKQKVSMNKDEEV